LLTDDQGVAKTVTVVIKQITSYNFSTHCQVVMGKLFGGPLQGDGGWVDSLQSLPPTTALKVKSPLIT